MSDVLYKDTLTPRAGTLRADIPGAIAIFCVIAFATGIIDEDIRKTMGDELLGCLAGAVAFGLISRRIRKSLEHRLVVFRHNGEVKIQIEGPRLHEDFGPGFTWSHGVSTERVDAYIYSRDAQVTWVQFQSMNRRVVTIRHAHGIQESVPHWPKQPAGSCLETRSFSGEPIPLYDVLFDFCRDQLTESKSENKVVFSGWSDKAK